MKKIRVFSLFLEFEVRLRKFEFDFDFRAKVRQVRSSDMSKFGCLKFNFFEFVPPLIQFMMAKKITNVPHVHWRQTSLKSGGAE